jgi:hypothetical protein
MSKKSKPAAAEPVAPAAAKVAKGRAVTLNGVGYSFGARDPLKREYAGLPATIDGAAGSVVIIASRNFADSRVWVTLSDGTVGRFLVPPGVDLSGELVIESRADAVAYDREALRTRSETRARKAATDNGVVVAVGEDYAEV